MASETILIVEDDEMLREWVSYELQQEGYNIKNAADGQIALTHASAPPHPDLILLDVQLPKLDGFEVCRRLQSDPLTASIPVIFLTARTTLNDQQEGFDAGGVDYLTKPFTIAALKMRVNAFLARQRKAQARTDAVIESFKRDLAHIMNHELLTPMTQIIGSLDLLKDEKVTNNPEAKDAILGIARSGTDRLHWLLRGLLLIKQIVQGDVQIDRRSIKLSQCLGPVIEQITLKYKTKHITLQQHGPEECLIGIRSEYLQQILYQLLDNAYKHSPANQVVTITITPEGNNGVIIDIHNNGQAIPSEYHEKIFDKFYQIDMSSTRPVNGAGLGLFIARTLAHYYNGEVTVDSSPNEGATFRFTLPSYDGILS